MSTQIYIRTRSNITVEYNERGDEPYIELKFTNGDILMIAAPAQIIRNLGEKLQEVE